jgi:hypothetical protein
VDPEYISSDGHLGRHLAVVHSPQEAAEYAGHMPTSEIETTQRAARWSEASRWKLRQVVVSDSDFHVSDGALIVLPVCPILAIEQLKIRGMADGVDHA